MGFKYDTTGFTVIHNDPTLFRHTIRRPALSVGTAKLKFIPPRRTDKIRKTRIMFTVLPVWTVGANGPVPEDFLYNEAKVKGYCVKSSAGDDFPARSLLLKIFRKMNIK